MNRVLPALFVLLLVVPASGGTVFHYQAYQSDGRRLPSIHDEGEAGNNGTADAGFKYSDATAQTGVGSSVGNRSLNGRGVSGIISSGTQELANSLIAEAGGFTMEAWFLWWGGGTGNSLIDYAGSEKLLIDTRQGNGNEIRLRINDDTERDMVIGTAKAQTWQYVAAVFDTHGSQVDDGSITGKFELYLDGKYLRTTDEVTITDLGDSRNLGIGTSKTPLNEPDAFFSGLVYEPRVTMGALDSSELLYVGIVPEPSSMWLGVMAFCGFLVIRRYAWSQCMTVAVKSGMQTRVRSEFVRR